MKLYLNDLGLLCALGNSQAGNSLRGCWRGDRSGLKASDEFGPTAIVGACEGMLPEIDETHIIYNCRNNRLLLAALAQIKLTVNHMIGKYGKNRIGVVLGTSTSGVRSTELALAYQAEHGKLPDRFHYKQQQMGAGADFVAAVLSLGGPAFTLSTACSASGKAFASCPPAD